MRSVLRQLEYRGGEPLHLLLSTLARLVNRSWQTLPADGKPYLAFLAGCGVPSEERPKWLAACGRRMGGCECGGGRRPLPLLCCHRLREAGQGPRCPGARAEENQYVAYLKYTFDLGKDLKSSMKSKVEGVSVSIECDGVVCILVIGGKFHHV